MTDRDELELLNQIVKLYVKFGPEAFETLADRISSPTFATTLAAIMRATAQSGRANVKARPNINRELERLKELEPEKHALLESFTSDLRARRILPNVRDIRRFAAENGLQPVTAESREQAIPQLIRGLMPSSMAELKKLLLRAKQTQNYESNLSQWSEIITKGMSRSPS